ncbi:MAG: Crp/Fnr family transcriptional regulator [Salana multivorans]|uniref:Crp/Fnr family transcriptional regulator n=1 Tax=Salana multivorans TaxID=120377 RepID=UPI000B05D166|nr:hypothetical protein [Salana multivorans]MBN8880896.1 Crp/Fnr family transcriptional regulator [Salana multivorans]
MTPAHHSVLLMLRQLGRRYTSGPLPEWDTFAASTRLLAFNPREVIPSTERDVFIVVRGLVKIVNADPEVVEPYVEEFIEAPGVMAPRARPSWASSTGAPLSFTRARSRAWGISPTDLVAIERSHLLRADYRVLEGLAARHPQWGQVHAAFLWTGIESVYSAARTIRLKDAEQRYRDLLKHRSSLAARVSQRDLASYLNVTESALSRIARRVRETPTPPAAPARSARATRRPSPGEPASGVRRSADPIERSSTSDERPAASSGQPRSTGRVPTTRRSAAPTGRPTTIGRAAPEGPTSGDAAAT